MDKTWIVIFLGYLISGWVYALRMKTFEKRYWSTSGTLLALYITIVVSTLVVVLKNYF